MGLFPGVPGVSLTEPVSDKTTGDKQHVDHVANIVLLWFHLELQTSGPNNLIPSHTVCSAPVKLVTGAATQKTPQMIACFVLSRVLQTLLLQLHQQVSPLAEGADTNKRVRSTSAPTFYKARFCNTFVLSCLFSPTSKKQKTKLFCTSVHFTKSVLTVSWCESHASLPVTK